MLDLTTQTWSPVDGSHTFDGHSAVMYRPGKIMKSGTAADVGVSTALAAATTYVLDMTAPSPAWRATAPMAFRRAFHTLTSLPDGTVLVTGGGSRVDGIDTANAVFAAELWTPTPNSESWKTMASMQTPRLYHGNAVLLPDGRVLVSGGGRFGPAPQFSAEIFSPPYLFKGARPSITSAPGAGAYNQTVFVGTPDAAQISSVSLIALSSATHGFDAGQRFVSLSFSQAAGGLNVQLPANANLATPGYYMLFLVNSAGVPSVSTMILMGQDATPLLDIAPSSIAAVGIQNGPNPASQTLVVANERINPLNWTATVNQSWLAVNPSSGTTPSSATVTFSTAGLLAGTYSATITVTAPTASNSPQTVPVTLVLTPTGSNGTAASFAFDEGVGTIAVDSSGNGNNGTISNATWTQGKFGTALSFNGTSSFVTVLDAAPLDLGATGTVEAWVKPSAVNRWNGVIAKGSSNDDNAQNYAIEVDDTNHVRCGIGNGGSFRRLVSTATLAVNQFAHLACTWNGTTLAVYVNGNLDSFVAQALTPAGNTAPLSIGQFGGNSDRFNGVIDEVRIYNRALTLAQIQQDMNTPIGVGTPDTTPPTAPSNLTATAVSTSQINLSWTASTDNVAVTGYQVERCQGSGCGNFALAGSPTGTTFNDTTGLQAGTTYTYRVRASDAVPNFSTYSNTAAATTPSPDTTPPTAPSNLTATAVGPAQINLSWTASTDNVAVTGYQVERCQGSGCGNFALAGSPTGTTFNDTTGLQAGTTYTYRVRASDAVPNFSTYSNTAAATTPSPDTTPPTAPSNLTATAVGPAQINLSWTASTDNVAVTGYQVERCQGSGCGNFALAGSPTGTTFNDTTGLQAGTTYTYRVRASDAIPNFSTYSNTATATTQAAQGLNAAYGFNEGAGSTTVDSSGNGNHGTLSGATWTTQGKFGNALSFNGTNNFVTVPDAATLDLGATGTVEAWVKLAAVNRWNGVIAKGNVNSDSAHNYAIEIDDTNHVRCGLGNGSSFRVLVSTATLAVNQFFHLACTWDGTTLSVYINGALNTSTAQALTPAGNTAPLSIGQFGGNSDRFSGVIDEVRLYNRALTLAQIQQDMNAPIGGGTPDTTPPTAPSNLTATAVGQAQINLSWTASTDNVAVTGYQVERCQGSGCGTFALAGSPTGTTFNDTTGLQAGTTYSYRVRASDAVPNFGTYSNTAAATTQAAPPPDTTPPTAPTNLTATAVGPAQINLSWTASTDNVAVTGYQVERCQGSGCGTFALAGSPTGTTFNDTTGLQAGTTYTYRVRANDAVPNFSTYSNTAAATTQAAQGLSAAYGFNEGAGSTTVDSSGNGNHGTLSGATWTTQGKFGNAVSFNGTNNFVTVPDAATLDLGATGTVEAWVKLAAVNRWNGVIAKGNANSDDAQNYAIEIDDTNHVRCGLGNGSSFRVLVSTATLAVNQFYHLACTWDGTTLSVYINGALNTSTAQALTPAGNTAPLSIGQFGGNSDRFSGVIDEVRLYNRALTLAQIQQDMNAPIGGGTPDTTPPTAPSNLTATAVGTAQINLSWTASTDNVAVTGYQVERCLGAGCSNFALAGSPTGTSFNDTTGLQPATTYTYRVRASDAVPNFSTYSNTATATTPALPPPDTTPPTAPSNLTATAVGPAQINLSWTASTDNVAVTGYQVERCQGAGCGTFALAGSPTGTTFNDTTGLQAGTTYTYRVRANDAVPNFSTYSNTATATTQAAQGLNAAYGFNEGAGSTTVDSSGNGNHGTLSGATWTTQGKFGNALSFNGTNNFVTVPDAATLDLGATGTVEAWVKLAAVNRWNGVIAKGNVNSDNAHNYAIEIDDTNHVRCGLGNGSSFRVLVSTATLAVNQFYHLACTWNGTTLALYVNGIPDSSVAQALTPAGNTAPLSIGQFGGNSDRFSGVIDEVRLYNRALSATEIQQDSTTPIQ